MRLHQRTGSPLLVRIFVMPAPGNDALEIVDARAVRAFETNGRLELDVTFSDGLRKVVNIKPLLTGIRQRLLYPDQFSQVRVESGSVVWPGERVRPGQAHITDLSIETATLRNLDPVVS